MKKLFRGLCVAAVAGGALAAGFITSPRAEVGGHWVGLDPKITNARKTFSCRRDFCMPVTLPATPGGKRFSVNQPVKITGSPTAPASGKR